MFSYIKKYGLLIACLFVILGLGMYNVNAAVRSVGSDTSAIGATEEKSCWQQGFRAVSCPGGGCPSCYDKINDKWYYKKADCSTIGYVSSCPEGQVLDPSTKLSCNTSYSSKCICDTNIYKYTTDNCSNELGGETCILDGKTYHKTCDCSSKYSKTCSGDYVPENAGDSCGGKYKSCICDPNIFKFSTCTNGPDIGAKTCVEENGSNKYTSCKPAPKTCVDFGYVSSCPVGQTGEVRNLTPFGLVCYTNCKAPPKTCEQGGYLSSVPTGKKCTNVTYAEKTCYKDCVLKTCADLIRENEGQGKLNKVIFSDMTVVGVRGDYYGPKCFDYPACQKLNTPKITSTSVAFADVRFACVDVDFDIDKRNIDPQCYKNIVECYKSVRKEGKDFERCVGEYYYSAGFFRKPAKDCSKNTLDPVSIMINSWTEEKADFFSKNSKFIDAFKNCCDISDYKGYSQINTINNNHSMTLYDANISITSNTFDHNDINIFENAPFQSIMESGLNPTRHTDLMIGGKSSTKRLYAGYTFSHLQHYYSVNNSFIFLGDGNGSDISLDGAVLTYGQNINILPGDSIYIEDLLKVSTRSIDRIDTSLIVSGKLTTDKLVLAGVDMLVKRGGHLKAKYYWASEEPGGRISYEAGAKLELANECVIMPKSGYLDLISGRGIYRNPFKLIGKPC